MPSQYHRVPPSRSGSPASSAWCGAPGVITNSSQTHQKMPIFSRYRVGWIWIRRQTRELDRSTKRLLAWQGIVQRDRGGSRRGIKGDRVFFWPHEWRDRSHRHLFSALGLARNSPQHPHPGSERPREMGQKHASAATKGQKLLETIVSDWDQTYDVQVCCVCASSARRRCPRERRPHFYKKSGREAQQFRRKGDMGRVRHK